MKNASDLFEKINQFETEGLYIEAQRCRQKILSAAECAEEEEFISLCDFLIREKKAVRGIEGTAVDEPYYSQLHEMVCQKLGSDHILAALAKRKMAKVATVQGRYPEAVGWLEMSLPVLIAIQGAKSWEVREAKGLIIELMCYIDPAKAKARAKTMEEEERKLFPICEHLKEVEDYVLALGIKNLSPTWRFGPSGQVRLECDAWLDVSSLREKFQLDPCVEVSEWDDPKGDSGRALACAVHRDLIVGYFDRRPNKPVVS